MAAACSGTSGSAHSQQWLYQHLCGRATQYYCMHSYYCIINIHEVDMSCCCTEIIDFCIQVK